MVAMLRWAQITRTSAPPNACVKATSNHRCYSRLGGSRKDAAAIGGGGTRDSLRRCAVWAKWCPPRAFPAGIRDPRQRNGQVHTNQQAGFTPCSAAP